MADFGMAHQMGPVYADQDRQVADHAPGCGRYRTDPDGVPNPKPCDCGADHDGHTINVGREADHERVAEGSCTDYQVVIDTETTRSAYRGMPGHLAVDRLCDEVDRLRAEVDRLRAIRDLAVDALAELDAQPELAHPDAVWYTGAALRDAMDADR